MPATRYFYDVLKQLVTEGNIVILKNKKGGVVLALALISVSVAWTAYAFQDKNFWNEAAQSGMAEVALGNLGQQKAQNEKVKEFADQMVKDHSAVNDELKSIASGKNVTLPTAVSAKQKATYDKLNGLSGADFDREFMKVMVKDHEAAVKLFDKQSKTDADADAKAFAAKHLPTLQGHLQTAQSLSGEVKQNSKNSNSGGNSGSSNKSNSNSNNR